MIGLIIILLTLPPVPENYKLQIGDEVAVTVSGKINFTYSQVISPQGTIFIQSGGKPLQIPSETQISPPGGAVLGALKIIDFTVNDARGKIEEEFNKYFKDINITLTITKFQDVVYVTGAVALPGPYPFYPGRPVMEYIGLAGGVTERADLNKSYIIRGNYKIPLDKVQIDRNDMIVVKYLTFKWWQDYANIASIVTTAAYTIVITWLNLRSN